MATLLDTIQNLRSYADLENKVIFIMNLITFGILDNIVEDTELYKFNSGVNTRRGFKKVEKILQQIIEKGVLNMFEVYRKFYPVVNGILVLENIPLYGTLKFEDTEEKIETIHIHDTLYQLSATPLFITKMTNSSYICLLSCYDEALRLSTLLNKSLINNQTIRAYAVKTPSKVIKIEDISSIAAKGSILEKPIYDGFCIGVFVTIFAFFISMTFQYFLS
jgi:hypothetical protein